MSTIALQQFVANLKSRYEHVRYKAVNDLALYVKSELREATADEINNFLDEFNHHIFEMVSSNDVNEKKGGILAIGKYLFLNWKMYLCYRLIFLVFVINEVNYCCFTCFQSHLTMKILNLISIAKFD